MSFRLGSPAIAQAWRTPSAVAPACWKCRARREEIEHAIADFVRIQQREFDDELSPVQTSRLPFGERQK
jgi:hypothetical protein